MAEIIKTYRQSLPAVRFVGKKCDGEGPYKQEWENWFRQGWFILLEDLPSVSGYEDAAAYLGLMRYKPDELFEYYIGMFRAAESDVPSGFMSLDFPASQLGVNWIKGQAPEIYRQEEACRQALESAGMRIVPADDGAFWFFERYAEDRFTTPDEQGEMILDFCYFIA